MITRYKLFITSTKTYLQEKIHKYYIDYETIKTDDKTILCSMIYTYISGLSWV